MEITVKIPQLNRAKLIIGVIVVFWLLFVKVLYDGTVYIYDGTHTERVQMMTVYDGKKDNAKYIEFARPNGDIMTKRYAQSAASTMQVGNFYLIEVPDDKTVYNCIGFVLACFAHIVGGIGSLFFLVCGGACVVMWTIDLIHLRPFRTIKQAMKDWDAS